MLVGESGDRRMRETDLVNYCGNENFAVSVKGLYFGKDFSYL